MDNKDSNSISKVGDFLPRLARGHFRSGVQASGSGSCRRHSYWRWQWNLMKDRLAIFVVVLIMAGCNSNIKQANTAIFLRNGLDLSHISRVAVLPFDYLTGGEANAKRVREICIAELQASARFEVVDREKVDTTLREMAINSKIPLDKSALNLVAKKLEVNGFLSGTVNKIEGRGWGPAPYPEISLTLHLIDAETARVVWRSTAYRNAYSDSRGLNRDRKSKHVVTREMLRDLIASIPE